MNETLPERPVRLWSAILVAAAILIALFFGAAENFAPEPAAEAGADTALPVAIEPQGKLAEPPAVFRWTPGGDDVDVAQVTLYRANLEPFWYSAPVKGPPLEIFKDETFLGIQAGENLFWRVREVKDGRPRAASGLAEFSFEKDLEGRGPGESVPEAAPIPLE